MIYEATACVKVATTYYAIVPKRFQRLADHGHVGIGKNDGKCCLRHAALQDRQRCRISSSNTALVGGFMQYRQIVRGVTRNENGTISATHCCAIVQRNAILVGLGDGAG